MTIQVTTLVRFGTGWPHWGQAAALLLILAPHALQLINEAMRWALYDAFFNGLWSGSRCCCLDDFVCNIEMAPLESTMNMSWASSLTVLERIIIFCRCWVESDLNQAANFIASKSKPGTKSCHGSTSSTPAIAAKLSMVAADSSRRILLMVDCDTPLF